MSLSSSAKKRFRLNPIQKEFEQIRKGYVLLLVLPLAIQLLIFKLVKFSILTSPPIGATSFDNYLGAVLAQHAPMPILVSGLAIIVSLLAVMRVPILGYAFLPIVVGVTGIIGKSTGLILDNPPRWVSLEFLEVARLDVALILVYAAAALIALKYLRSWLLTSAVVLLHIIGLTIALLSAIEFGYFAETGSLADSFMLRYALTHFSNVKVVVASEMSMQQVLLLAVAFASTLLPILYRWRMRSSAAIKRYNVHKKSVPFPVPLLVILAAISIVVPATELDGSLEPISDNLVVQMFKHQIEGEEVLDFTPAAPGEFGIPVAPVSLTEGGTRLSRNVVLIVLESTRAISTTVHTPDLETTPFLGQLADSSLVVEDMSTIVPHTNNALVPILCGVYPKVNQDESEVPPGANCLPRLLGEEGFETAFFTPARLDFENKGRMLGQMGFEEIRGNAAFDKEGFERVNYFGFEDRVMLQPAVDWATEKASAGSPFFLSMLTLTPHHDYDFPMHHEEESYTDQKGSFNKYLNALRYQDDFVRDLVAKFDKAGLMDSTTFVFIGDHGEAFGEHGELFHNSLWQEGIHVPAIVSLPSRESRPITGPRQQVDIFNTVVEILGYDIEGGPIPGASLMQPVDENRRMFLSTWIQNQAMALRIGDKKFIYRFRRQPPEYYDLSEDPGERNNIVDSLPEDSIASMELSLIRWRKAVMEMHKPQ